MARIEDEVGMDPTVNLRLGVALALGLIIGIERGWERRGASEGMRTAGVRTFGFAGLSGAVAALLADELGQAVLAAALLGFAALVTASYLATARPSEDYGFTTELVLLLTFGLGAMAMSGHEIEAVAAAVVTALVLGFKRELHRSLERLEEREVRATLQLLAIALVVLPLVPNQGMGPWQALNPRTIGLLVLLIASISYVGYFAIRLLGARRGLLLTAFFGGLSSSTAVTVAFARMAAAGGGGGGALAGRVDLDSASRARRGPPGSGRRHRVARSVPRARGGGRDPKPAGSRGRPALRRHPGRPLPGGPRRAGVVRRHGGLRARGAVGPGRRRRHRDLPGRRDA
jgi:uncharacterized membrane protein YhiD involved in acid resistance